SALHATPRPPIPSRLVFSSRRRHTRSKRDWSSDVCSSDLGLKNIVRQWAHLIQRKREKLLNCWTTFQRKLCMDKFLLKRLLRSLERMQKVFLQIKAFQRVNCY